MNRYITVVFLLLGFSAVSCDKEYPFDYYRCHCHENGIGGWEIQNDTTVTNRKDTVGGFEMNAMGYNSRESGTNKIFAPSTATFTTEDLDVKLPIVFDTDYCGFSLSKTL